MSASYSLLLLTTYLLISCIFGGSVSKELSANQTGSVKLSLFLQRETEKLLIPSLKVLEISAKTSIATLRTFNEANENDFKVGTIVTKLTKYLEILDKIRLNLREAFDVLFEMGLLSGPIGKTSELMTFDDNDLEKDYINSFNVFTRDIAVYFKSLSSNEKATQQLFRKLHNGLRRLKLKRNIEVELDTFVDLLLNVPNFHLDGMPAY